MRGATSSIIHTIQIKVKVRPITENDYNNFFKTLGLDPNNLNKEVKELILSNLSRFKDAPIANSFVEIDGEWHYKLFYTII